MSKSTTSSNSSASADIRDLVLQLYDVQAVCLGGQYKLKSGLLSPIYVDLRMIISYPSLLQSVVDHIWSLIENISFDLVCGVPYTALPIASILSIQHSKPMIMRRKEAKTTHGLKKALEGVYKANDVCMIIEDLVTSGISVFETVEPLQSEKLIVNDVVVLIDRQQGARMNIEKRGLNLHSVVTMEQVLNILYEEKRINDQTLNDVKKFISENQVALDKPTESSISKSVSAIKPALSYSQRIQHVQNAAGKLLLSIAVKKQSNLCVSADVTTSRELLELADRCGPYICCLKTHVDIVTDFTPQLVQELVQLSNKHNFLLFEDRKFADIGSTVQSQYSKGVYKIADWAHIINAHVIPGPMIITGLQQAAEQTQQSKPLERGLLLIAEMSSEGNLAIGEYTTKNVQWAEANQSFVCGFITQHQLTDKPGLLHLTPGVQIVTSDSSSKGDGLGQQYNDPAHVIAVNGADFVIVGRAIYKQPADKIASVCQQYQRAGWDAYSSRVHS